MREPGTTVQDQWEAGLADDPLIATFVRNNGTFVIERTVVEGELPGAYREACVSVGRPQGPAARRSDRVRRWPKNDPCRSVWTTSFPPSAAQAEGRA